MPKHWSKCLPAYVRRQRAEAERREAARRSAAQAELEAKSGHVPAKMPPKGTTNVTGPKVGG